MQFQQNTPAVISETTLSLVANLSALTPDTVGFKLQLRTVNDAESMQLNRHMYNKNIVL